MKDSKATLLPGRRVSVGAGIRVLGTSARFCLALALLAAAGPAAFAQLERVGPVDSRNGYPVWYQDKTGLALEFCQVANQAELDGGWCLLLPGDTSAPEAFPSAFSEEHFYWSATAAGTLANGAKATLVLALEGAFANGPVAAGDQIVFGRVRIKVTQLPASGTYTVLHPFGTEKIEGVAGDRLFFTRDIGISGGFDAALSSDIGPFLLPSNTPGGAELPAVQGPVSGKLYIADPARLGPVTGSRVGQNFFRILGPDGSVLVDTTAFSLQGRVFTGTIPGRVVVDRATYTNTGSSTQVDVFATANPTIRGRLPGGPLSTGVTPQLSFFNAPCVEDPTTGARSAPVTSPQGTLIQTPMIGAGSGFWGQLQPSAIGLPGIPDQVCVQDTTAQNALGQITAAFFTAAVTDEVYVTQAQYDAAARVLSVNAVSSDLVNSPILKADVYGQAMTVPGTIASAVPPIRVAVASSAGGRGVLKVKVVGGSGTGGVVIPATNHPPLAANDSATAVANTPTTINVLANDSDPDGAADLVPASVTLATAVSGPAGAVASASPNPAGDGTIIFNANGPGTYTFLYSVSDRAGASSSATVTVTINAVITGPETITATALFRNDQKRWVVNGTDSVIANQVLTIAYANGTLKDGTATGTPIAGTAKALLGSTAVTATGAWAFDVRGVTGLLDPTSTSFLVRPTQLIIKSALGGSVTVPFTFK